MKAAIVFGETAIDILIEGYDEFFCNEKVRGNHYVIRSGGMGANQAVVLSQLGIKTYLITRIGNDELSNFVLSDLQKYNLLTEGVFLDQGSCALAIIATNQKSESRVLAFVEGVNSHVNYEDVARFRSLAKEAQVALFQLGYPTHIVASAIIEAKNAGLVTILDPAHYRAQIPSNLYSSIDIIIPNQHEVQGLVGFPVHNCDDAIKAASVLHRLGTRTVIITMGDMGTFCSNENSAFFVPSFETQVVDTVGAGDAFAGGFAAGLVHGLSIRKCVLWGNASAAIAVTDYGAQSAHITLQTIDKMLDVIDSSFIKPLKLV